MTKKKWNFDPSQLEAYEKAPVDLIPLHAPNAVDQRGRPIGKAPFKGWRKDRALTFQEAREHLATGQNVGVRLKSDDLVVDVDPRNFKEGDDPIRRLQDDLKVSFDGYPTVQTGSGGLHIYMKMKAGTLLRDTLEDYQGVEFKSEGRQVVAAGSCHPDANQPYIWLEDPLLGLTISDEVPQAPAALVKMATRTGRVGAVDAGSVTPEALGDMLEGLDVTDYRDHEAWLSIMMACHHATGGEGRDEFLEWCAGDPQYSNDNWLNGRRWDSLHADQAGRRVTEKTLYKALKDAGRSDLMPLPPRSSASEDFPEDLSDEYLDDFADPADADARASFQEVIRRCEEEGGDARHNVLEHFNNLGHRAVLDGGRFGVFRETIDYTWPGGPRKFWQVSKKTDFLDYYANVKVQKLKPDGNFSVVKAATEWLEWAGRPQHEGVAFDPGNRIPKHANILNLWTGWAVEPKKGDWSLLKKLLLEGLCDGDVAMYNYVLNWSAFMVQFPDKPAEVALVFRGGKGTGKGTYFRALGQLAGRHSLQISDQHHLTNHFNAHLRDCIFLFADEAMWGGDKKAESSLKQLITEPILAVELKGKDVFAARNLLHIGMASNEDWVFPASLDDERRLAISDVNTKFQGNVAFFEALNAQMQNGGLQAMLWELQLRDISTFHPRKNVPQTTALANQKIQSLDNWDSWWYNSLCTGSLTLGEEPIIGDWDKGPAIFAADDLKASLEHHLRKLNDRSAGRRSLDTVMGQRIRKRLGFEVKKARTTCPDERLDLAADRSGRVPCYRLPSLEKCRELFEEHLGSSLAWDANVVDIDGEEGLDLDAYVQEVDDLATLLNDPLDESRDD